MRGTESGRVEKEPRELSQMMQNQKVNYFHDFTSILKIPKTNPKIYGPTIELRYSGKKIIMIPLLLVDDNIATNFKEKANHFNKYFSSHKNLHQMTVSCLKMKYILHKQNHALILIVKVYTR